MRSAPALALALAAALAPAGVAAQTLRADCTVQGIDAVADPSVVGARARFHPNANRSRDTLQSLDRAVPALRAIRADFASDPGLPRDHPWRRALALQLDSAIAEVERARDSIFTMLEQGADTTAALVAWGVIRQTRFEPVPIGADLHFPTTDPVVRLTGATAPGERQAVCWTARRASRVLEQLVAPAYVLTARALTATLRDWDRFDREGLSQFPWEAALNGRKGFCPLPVQGPPTCQWVLLHPSLGYSLRALGDGDDVTARLRGRQAVVVDVIGKVTYRDGWRSYRGWSLFALLGNQPPGAGLTLHLDRAVQVGAGIGVGPGGKWDRGLGYLSLDAYRWASDIPAKLQQRRDAVRGVRDRIVGGGESP